MTTLRLQTFVCLTDSAACNYVLADVLPSTIAFLSTGFSGLSAIMMNGKRGV